MEKRNSPKEWSKRRPGKRIEGESSPSIMDDIKELAARDARNIASEREYFLFLSNWWCNKWNRPLKDPLLAEYTLEELIYEFHSFREYDKASEERLQQEADRIEDDKYDAQMAVIEAMEAEDRAREEREAAETASNPVNNPINQKWMEELIRKDKELHGEEYGEDLELNF